MKASAISNFKWGLLPSIQRPSLSCPHFYPANPGLKSDLKSQASSLPPGPHYPSNSKEPCSAALLLWERNVSDSVRGEGDNIQRARKVCMRLRAGEVGRCR